MNGTELIAAERQRQIDVEGWTPEHDNKHEAGELVAAAAVYALETTFNGPAVAGKWFKELWCFEDSWYKPSPDPIRNLVKAGALIAAEIDRLRRAKGEFDTDWRDILGAYFDSNNLDKTILFTRVYHTIRRSFENFEDITISKIRSISSKEWMKRRNCGKKTTQIICAAFDIDSTGTKP